MSASLLIVSLIVNFTIFSAAVYLIPYACPKAEARCWALRLIYGLIAIGAGGAFFALLFAGHYLPSAQTLRSLGTACLLIWKIAYHRRERRESRQAVWGFLGGLFLSLLIAGSGQVFGRNAQAATLVPVLWPDAQAAELIETEAAANTQAAAIYQDYQNRLREAHAALEAKRRALRAEACLGVGLTKEQCQTAGVRQLATGEFVFDVAIEAMRPEAIAQPDRKGKEKKERRKEKT